MRFYHKDPVSETFTALTGTLSAFTGTFLSLAQRYMILETRETFTTKLAFFLLMSLLYSLSYSVTKQINE